MDDLGEPLQTCEMCTTAEIRYVHVMEHPGYRRLEVGCVCASRMERVASAAWEREKELRKRARRRRDWMLAEWKSTAKGNRTRKVRRGDHRVRLVLEHRGDAWLAWAKVDERWVGGKRRFPTGEAAKRALFDYFDGWV